MKWTETEIKKSIELLINGNSLNEISNSLKRTERSVRVKLNKLGYKSTNYHKLRFHEIKICGNCFKSFESLKSEKRKFCSSSCAATINNKKVIKKIKLEKTNEKTCNNCGKICKEKYCSTKCFQEFRKTKIIRLIENGDTKLPSRSYKKYLIEKHGEKCMECDWNKKNPITKKVPIEIEHIDGNSENNSLENLKLLCPNCHSLTPTFKGLNRGNGRFKRMERYNNGKSF